MSDHCPGCAGYIEPEYLQREACPGLAANPVPAEAMCGAILTCALPIMHEGVHERADGVQWTWPANPAPAGLDVERLAEAMHVAEGWDKERVKFGSLKCNHPKTAAAIADEYARPAAEEEG